MSAIEIERIALGPNVAGQAYEVVIDGEVRGRIKCGETQLFEVMSGVHTVRLGPEQHSAPMKVVVGMGKTSLICHTRQHRRFPFFPPGKPNTQILVREEVAAIIAPPPARLPRISPLDAPWLEEISLQAATAPDWAHETFAEPERLAAD